MTTTVDLRQDQIQQLIETNQQQVDAIGAAARSGAVPAGNFVFFAAFNGTNNDLSTNPFDLHNTNVAQLFEQANRPQSPGATLVSRHYSGPGTPGTLDLSSWLPPRVTSQVILTAERAYGDFRNLSADWLNSGGSGVSVVVSAFSRGSASAAIFSQMLFERGLTDPETGAVLIAPGQVGVSAGVLFDPVMTGVSGNLAFAPNATNIVSIVAANEYRNLFTAADYRSHPGIQSVRMIGNHSDIGGPYDRGIGAQSLQAATAFLQRSGVPIANVDSERSFVASQFALHSEERFADGRPQWDVYAQFSSLDVNADIRLHSPVATPGMTTVSGGVTTRTLTLYNGYVVTVTTPGDAHELRVEQNSVLPANRTEQVIKHYDGLGGGETELVDEVTDSTSANGLSRNVEAKVFVEDAIVELDAGDARTSTVTLEGVDGVHFQAVVQGGTGFETIQVTDGTAQVAIRDADGSGRILLSDERSVVPAGVAAFADPDQPNTWTAPRPDGGTITYTQNSPLTIVDSVTGNRFVIEEFSEGDFGIHLLDRPGAEAPVANVVTGTANADGEWALGGLVFTPLESGLAGADEVRGLAGDDALAGRDGEDRLYGDEGSDYLLGGLGDDLLAGGADTDILLGQDGDDALYAEGLVNGDFVQTMQAAIASDATPAGTAREFLGGGAGNDLLVGGTGADLLSGGQGIDVLIGGAGADAIWGDTELVATARDWSVGAGGFVNVTGASPPAGAGGDDRTSLLRCRNFNSNRRKSGSPMRRALTIAIGVASICMGGNALSQSKPSGTVVDHFRSTLAAIDKRCREDKLGPYLDPRDPEYKRKRGIGSCDILKLEPRDWKHARLVKLESQAYPVPEHWLETPEGRFAHKIKLPSAVDMKTLHLEGLDGEAAFSQLCAISSGAFVIKRTEGVDGFIEGRSSREPSPNYRHLAFWAEEKGSLSRDLQDRLVQPPLGRYRFLERWERSYSNKGAARLVRYERGPDSAASKTVSAHIGGGQFAQVPYVVQRRNVESSAAQYGVTWRGIWPGDAVEMGIEGFELIVYSVSPFEVLAVRRDFFRHQPAIDHIDKLMTKGEACSLRRSFNTDVAFIGNVLIPKSK